MNLKASLEEILKILDVMAQFEVCLSELYEAFAQADPELGDFWRGLAAAEFNHFENIRRMASLIENKCHTFQGGRTFNLAVLNTAIKGVMETKGKIQKGGLTREKMLILARDYEQSLLESRYGEVVRSDDVEYQTLLNEILNQTKEHGQSIQKNIDALRRGR